jgi:hypothetical protein
MKHETLHQARHGVGDNVPPLPPRPGQRSTTAPTEVGRDGRTDGDYRNGGLACNTGRDRVSLWNSPNVSSLSVSLYRGATQVRVLDLLRSVSRDTERRSRCP